MRSEWYGSSGVCPTILPLQATIQLMSTQEIQCYKCSKKNNGNFPETATFKLERLAVSLIKQFADVFRSPSIASLPSISLYSNTPSFPFLSPSLTSLEVWTHTVMNEYFPLSLSFYFLLCPYFSPHLSFPSLTWQFVKESVLAGVDLQGKMFLNLLWLTLQESLPASLDGWGILSRDNKQEKGRSKKWKVSNLKPITTTPKGSQMEISVRLPRGKAHVWPTMKGNQKVTRVTGLPVPVTHG